MRHVALKLGGEGCLLASRETDFGEDSPSSTRFRVVPAVPGVHCVDATGAGDTFAASFQCALLAGEPPVRCAAYANAVASLCVEQPGATSAARAPTKSRAEETRFSRGCKRKAVQDALAMKLHSRIFRITPLRHPMPRRAFSRGASV